MTSYKKDAIQARRKVLEMIYKAQTSHIASNFSIIDVATVLYANLKIDDVVVWSKGWVAATIYYFLAKQGNIPYEDLDNFPNAPYLGLAETSVNGVLCNAGSVGHGSPIATGIALGKKRAGQRGNIYCILSDGELNEGSVWESVMVACHHCLDNLIFIIDANGWQAMGRTKDICNLTPIENRFRGFGFFALSADGHDYRAIESAFSLTKTSTSKQPKVIVFNTIKGKGISFMEDKLVWHYRNISVEDYRKAMAEL